MKLKTVLEFARLNASMLRIIGENLYRGSPGSAWHILPYLSCGKARHRSQARGKAAGPGSLDLPLKLPGCAGLAASPVVAAPSSNDESRAAAKNINTTRSALFTGAYILVAGLALLLAPRTVFSLVFSTEYVHLSGFLSMCCTAGCYLLLVLFLLLMHFQSCYNNTVYFTSA